MTCHNEIPTAAVGWGYYNVNIVPKTCDNHEYGQKLQDTQKKFHFYYRDILNETVLLRFSKKYD